MGALSCGILKSRPLWLPSMGVLGREKSTGAVRGALAYPPVKACAKELLRGVVPCEELFWVGRVLYCARRSSPGGKAEDEALSLDMAEGDDCCSDELPCTPGYVM